MSLRAFHSTVPTCARCGTRHTTRQRCPLDPQPQPEAPAATSVPPGRPMATVARGQSTFKSIVGYAVAVTATVVLITTLATAATAISDLTKADADVTGASTGLIASIAIGFVFGVGMLFLAKRTYAKVVYSILSVVLLTAGVLMMTFAPVYRQVHIQDIAGERTFRVLLLLGAASTAGGALLAVACVRWALRPTALARLKRWARIGGSIYGVVLGLEGLFMLLAMFALLRGQSTTSSNGAALSVVEQSIYFTVIAAWFFVPGVLLTYHGISASMGEGSSQYRAPVALLGLVLFCGVVGLGEVNMASSRAVAAPMPALHVLAAVLPGVSYVALASRGSFLRGEPVRGLTWRQVTLAFALSMGVAAIIASYVEGIGDVSATVLMLVHSGTFHHVVAGSGINYRFRHAKDILSTNEQWVANLIAIAVVPPVVEEFAKGLAARFMMRGNTTRAQAFVLGAAAGAGFGFLEGLLYGAGGISSSLGDWWAVMLVRAGSTSLHVFNTGLVALAWWYWSMARRRRTAVMLFGAAVLLHAVWNGFSVTLYSQILWLRTVDNRVLEIATYAVVAVIAVSLIGGIVALAQRLREPLPAPVEGTALAAMAPWLG